MNGLTGEGEQSDQAGHDRHRQHAEDPALAHHRDPIGTAPRPAPARPRAPPRPWPAARSSRAYLSARRDDSPRESPSAPAPPDPPRARPRPPRAPPVRPGPPRRRDAPGPFRSSGASPRPPAPATPARPACIARPRTATPPCARPPRAPDTPWPGSAHGCGYRRSSVRESCLPLLDYESNRKLDSTGVPGDSKVQILVFMDIFRAACGPAESFVGRSARSGDAAAPGNRTPGPLNGELDPSESFPGRGSGCGNVAVSPTDGEG